MPVYRLLCLTMLLILAACPASGPCAASEKAAPPVRLDSASELDYPPFALVLENGTADGFSVDMLKAVVRALDMDIRFQVGQWHRIKQLLADGKIDVLPFVSYSEERDRVFDFTAPYLRLQGTAFIRRDDTSISGLEDLKDREVIVMRGDNAHEYALKNRLTRKLVLTDTYESAMRLLSSGRHDAVLMLQLVGYQLLEKLKIENVVSIQTLKTSSLKPAGRPLSGYEQKFCFAVTEIG